MDCNGDNNSSVTIEPQSHRFQNDAVSAVDKDLKHIGGPDTLDSGRVRIGREDECPQFPMDCNGDNSSSLTVEPQSQRFQNDAVSAVDEDLKLVGAPLVAGAPDSLSSCRVGSGENRKRGRVPRGVVVKATTMPVKRQREEDEEEDVCFICFDGGSLVLCDRKGCPKAYHPACIKRDEAFFRAAAKWTCGWHICSVCQKASHYMCYTCTYSVCKGCTKTADYFCVRGNKGFCSTCMRIIKLIENIDQGNKEMVQVDFDDKSSWEYLFKVYWMYLKEKLSLTLSELIQAKKPWKEFDAVHAKRQRLPFGHRVVLDGKGVVGKSFDHLEQKKPKQLLEPPYKDHPGTENRTIAKPENLSVSSCTPQMELTQPIELELRSKDSLKTEEASISIGTSLNGSMEWASKELLELVAHMRNGDTSALSHFDVQTLLLDYIKRNNLRDPRRKSQIICDSRLKSLFGKPCVGHIEMLKLLEFHFLIKEDSQKSAFIPAGIIGTVTGPVETDDNNDISFLKTKTKKHKSRRSSEEKLVQTNLDEYAAIDAHNINLIYLRRDLMESLIEDMEKFHGKVIGSVVRIRICKKDQKQELYRLVHVIGTSKAFAPYKIRQKTANVLLEVLNLNKKETVPIDSISNQDFSEDECRRLRQIIKCGLVKRLTVGEIQKKAMELRAVKLNDSLEAEILRLNHLRDRASEKGRKKELRECVEKLEVLKMPEERQRRLRTIPEVHADPKMDPSYESDEDARESDEKKQEYVGPRYSRFSRREEQLTALCRKVKEGSITAQCKIIEKRAAHGNNMLKKIGSQSTACQAAVMPASEISTASLSTVNSISANNNETEKLWHYRDPSGKIQGPFSVMQLRKWNKSGLFPPDMRIWTNDEHVDSVLLTNALIGLFHKVHRVHREISPPSQELGDGSVNSSFGCCGTATGKGRECGEREVSWRLHITKNPSNGNTKITRMDGLSSSSPQCFDLNNTGKPKSSSPVPSSSQGDMYATPPRGKRCHEVVDFHSSTGHVVQGSSGSTVSQISNDSNHSMQSNSQSHLGQSSGQSWGSLTSNKSLVNMDSRSSIASVTKSSDSFEQKRIKDFPELPSPTPKTSCDDDIEAQVAEELLSLSSGVAVCASDIPDLPSPTPKLKGEDPDAQAAEKCESFPANVPVQDAGPSSSSASSLVIGGAQDPTPKLKGENLDGQAAANKESFPATVSVQDSGPSESRVSSLVIGGAQLPEIAKEWGGHSPGENPSMDSAVISGSSLKQAEAVGDHVDTPTSDANQLNQTSPSNPVSNFSGWEPIEFTTLDEDSVSDLLAEVDAMESQTRCGLGSPTSAMWCSDEMISASISDCFSSIEELSPMPDRAKNDALSSSGDIQLSCQSFLLGELAGASQTEGFDPSNRSSVNSSPSNEGETKSADASFPCVDAGPNIPAPCTTNQNTAVSVISLSTGAEALTIGYQAAPGNVNAGGPVDGYTNVGHGISMVTAQGNSNVSAPFTGNPV